MERATEKTPIEIINWLLFPYEYFGSKFSNDKFTLLDIACGENLQYKIIKPQFKRIISMDNHESHNIINGDISNIKLPNKSVDVTFSFETIEHIKPEKFNVVINELIRVTRKILVIGSVNKTGPEKLNDIVIYKNGLNLFHLNELDVKQWKHHFSDAWSHAHSVFSNNNWSMQNDLDSKNGISNYAIKYL